MLYCAHGAFSQQTFSSTRLESLNLLKRSFVATELLQGFDESHNLLET